MIDPVNECEKEFAGKVWSVHVKDHVGRESVAISKGQVDPEGIFEVLREAGYAGAITLELEVWDKKDPQTAASAEV